MLQFFQKSKLLLVLFILNFCACVSVDSNFGHEFIPDEQSMSVARKVLKISEFGTLTTTFIDTFPTQDFTVGFLGRMTTPEFGLSQVDMVTELSPSIADFKYPLDAIIDSVVMYVRFTTDKYGGDGVMNLKIHELTENLVDTIYYGSAPGFTVPPHKPNPLCVKTFKKSDTELRLVVAPTDTVGLLSRLRTTKTDSLFKTVFKGIYMTVDGDEDGVIAGVDMLTRPATSTTMYYAPTYLAVHYKYFHPTEQRDTVGMYTYLCKTISVRNTKTTNDKRFMIVKHSKKGEIESSPTLSYAQGFYGAVGSISMNSKQIETYVGRNLNSIAINRAELRFSLQHPKDINRLDDFYTPLLATYRKGRNKRTSVVSYSPTVELAKHISNTSNNKASTYDGAINRTRGGYSVEITHSLNAMIRTGKWDPILIFPQHYGQSIKSAVFVNDSTKLVITYTHVGQ